MSYRRFFAASTLVLLGLALSSNALASPPKLAPVGRWASLHAERTAKQYGDPQGRIPITVFLADDEESNELGLFRVAPKIGTRWVSPNELAHWTDHPGFWVSPPLRTQIDISATQWIHTQQVHNQGQRGKGVVVGIIDTGVDVTHRDLRNTDGSSRVAWLLDFSRAPMGKHPDLEEAFGCALLAQSPCAILSSDDINEEITSGGTDISSDTVGHGTHVTGIAASNGGSAKKYIGGAPDADLVIARVTRGASSAAITDGDVLNAASFVFERSSAMNRPAVLNVSLGGDFGPHDGTSPLEAGLSSLVGSAFPGRAIVVAAGNSGGIYRTTEGITYGNHSEIRVPEGSTGKVPIVAPAASGTIEGSVYIWIRTQDSDSMKLGVNIDGEERIEPLGIGEQGAKDSDDSYPYVGVINGVSGGTSPIPQGSPGGVVVIDGKWAADRSIEIVIEGQATAQIWLQSLDGANSAINNPFGVLLQGAIKQGTINTPASAPDLIAVGCTINRTSWTTLGVELAPLSSFGPLENPEADSACYFSASGPNALGNTKPEISAPGAFVISTMSASAAPDVSINSMFSAPHGTCPIEAPTCFVADNQHAVATGTSMSSPQVAGVIALLLEKDPTLTQPELVALLQAGARPFEGTILTNTQLGPGAVDAERALQVLEERGAPRNLIPDKEKSWWYLSSDFARPDGQWPIEGTIELRANDGGLADGFDTKTLELLVNNGALQQKLTKVAPGLWRFTVITPPGTGGQLLDLKLTYNGQTLAHKQLPIAADYWGTTSYPTINNGCATVNVGAGSNLPTLFGLYSLLSAVLLRRNRRRRD